MKGWLHRHPAPVGVPAGQTFRHRPVTGLPFTPHTSHNHRMPDTERPKPQPRLSTTKKVVLIALLLIVWTGLANTWTSKGCDLIPQSYFLVIGHWTPDRDEGCEDEQGTPTFTDDYQRWG